MAGSAKKRSPISLRRGEKSQSQGNDMALSSSADSLQAASPPKRKRARVAVSEEGSLISGDVPPEGLTSTATDESNASTVDGPGIEESVHSAIPPASDTVSHTSIVDGLGIEESVRIAKLPPLADTASPIPDDTPDGKIVSLSFRRKKGLGNLSDVAEPHDNDTAKPLSAVTIAKKRSKRAPVLVRNRVSDSSEDVGDSSDEMHSVQSLRMRRRDKGKQKDNDVKTLDSLPDIPDSGTARMKSILANPFIMPKDVEIDTLLQLDYPSLPPLRDSRLIPYRGGLSTSEESSHKMILYSSTMEEMNAGDGSLARFESAIKFVHAAPFINPSRASPLLVTRESNRISLVTSSARGKTAVLLTTGLLVESCLRTPAESGYNSANNVHQVLLTPLTGEFERAAAFVGTVFEEDHYCSLLTQGSLVFLTRPEGSDNNSTPQFKARSHTKLHASKPAAVGGSSQSSYFPSSMGFNDTVPIYDARGDPDFRFTASSLKSLDQLPRYRKDRVDPTGNRYIATVGYAPNSWTKTRGRNEFCVSMNVLFVIILGKTEHEVAV